MELTRLARHVHTMIQYRAEDVLLHYQGMSREERLQLEAMSAVADGELVKAKAFCEGLPDEYNAFYSRYLAEVAGGKKRRVKKLAMFLPHTRNTGGIAMLLNMRRMFLEMGVAVDLYVCYPYAKRNWSATVAGETFSYHTFVWDEDIEELAGAYEGAISSYFDLNMPLSKHFDKVMYFAQGDYGTLDYKPDTQQWLYCMHRYPVHILAVSTFLKEVLSAQFKRNAVVVPCGIDRAVFSPYEGERESILLVMGELGVPLKRVRETLQAVLQAIEGTPYRIIHITPREEKGVAHPQIETLCNLSTKEVSDYMKRAACYVQGSFVEGFSLPPLEAMAVGTPVVATDSGGLREYGRHGENLWLCKRDDFVELKNAVVNVLKDEELQNKFRKNGMETAKEYDKKRTDERLKRALEKFAEAPFIPRWSASTQKGGGEQR